MEIGDQHRQGLFLLQIIYIVAQNEVGPDTGLSSDLLNEICVFMKMLISQCFRAIKFYYLLPQL